MLPATRLGRALALPPDASAWRDTMIGIALFFAVAAPVALASGLASLPFAPPRDLPLLAMRVLLVPSLVEELLFRALPNPHPSEDLPWQRWLPWAGISLFAYVAAHPLNAWLFTPAARGIFDRPAFLLLVTLLGAIALVLYRRSGSLWPPLLLHWLAVTSWLVAGGEALLRG